MRIVLALALLLALSACGRTQSVVMTDPRTGVTVTCSSAHYNVFTPQSIRQEMGACVEELSFYGFHDNTELRAAHDAVPAPQRDPPWQRWDQL